MSVLSPSILEEAVRVVNAQFSPSDPKISFLGLRARLITEAHKRATAYLANRSTRVLDRPDLMRDDKTLQGLGNAVDALERGHNLTVMEAYRTL